MSRIPRPRKLCRRLVARLYRPYVLRRIAHPTEARLFGRTLLTDPEVFHPVYFLSTRVLIESLGALDLTGKTFLDMGTGSGAIGVFAAAAGARVTACDVNPRAVALARENLRRNGTAAEVVESDLFAALAGRVFDVISFNIPFYARAARTPLDAAFFGGEDLATVRAFVAGCPRFLAAAGTVVVIFSEDVDRALILSLFAAAGLDVTHERLTHRLFERFHVVRFQRVMLPPKGRA